MSSTDIKLPTSGSLNWGGGLNRYLENLNSEVANLQRLLTQKKENYHLVGYAGSGMVGECKIKYDASSHKVSFSGSIYLSGEYAYYTENLEVESSELSATPYPVFVFLTAEVITSGENQGEYTWRIVINDSFQIDYHYVLLGLFYRSSKVESFIPYYFSSAKTLAQHRHELIQRWADLNKNLTSLTITIKDKIPSISNTDLNWSGDFDLYCGGLGRNNETTTVLYPTGKYTVARNKLNTKEDGTTEYVEKDIDIILFKDTVEGEEGLVVTSKASWESTDFADDKSVYFRILLDIFGNIIIQKSLNDSILYPEKRQWSEQQLYNTRFASIESSIVSGDSSHSWEAGLPIEVARFGYNCKDIENITYVQNDHTPGLTNFNFVKSLDAGAAYQQAQNIYLTQDSEIWTDKVSFKKNESDPYNFVIDYTTDGESIYAKSFKNIVAYTVDAMGVQSMKSEYFIGNNYDDEKGIEMWKAECSDYVTDVNYVGADWGNIITSFKVKNSLDKICLFSSRAEGANISIVDTVYNFKNATDGLTTAGNLALCVTYEEATKDYLVKIGIYDSSSPSYGITSMIEEYLYQYGNYSVEITPYLQNTICFDFAATDRNPSTVLWAKTTTSESIELSSDGISLTSQADIIITTDKKFILTTSNDPSDKDEFTIALKNEIPLNITTSKLSLSNDLYVKNELSFGTEGFITLPSDKRLKTDIKDISYSFLDIVNRTPVLSFKYKGGKDIFVGLMAQDLQNNLPTEFKNVFVKTHETDQYKDQLCLTETKLVYVLWKALQEEVKNNEKLKEEICEIKKYLKL